MSALEKFSLKGKVAVVTGGNGILGNEFCRGLIESGAALAIIDLSSNSNLEVNETNNPLCEYFQCDIANKESIEKCIADIIDRFSKIDILINNAATKTKDVASFFAPFESYSLDIWKEVMSVNIDGMFLVAQCVGREMLKSGGGSIIQISSIYGMVGPDKRIYEGSDYLGEEINTPAVYAASKAAVIGLTKWMATYWADKNIRVNCLVPGGIKSGQNSKFDKKYSSRVPMQRMAHKEELVPAVLYLASEASSYVTGHVLIVDGGKTAW